MKGKQSSLSGVLVCVALGMLIQVAAGQSWTAAGPVARSIHSAVLDTSTNRMIVFGGAPSSTNTNGTQNLNDVWRLNINNLTWKAAKPKGTPPAPRIGHSAVYDPGSNRMIVFGGGLGRSSPCENDVWVLTNANGEGGAEEWIQLNPAGSAPAPRIQHGSVYDPNTNTMIVYGGQDCFSTLYSDVWVLSHANGLGGTPTWTQLAPAGTSPGARELTGCVTYDPTNNIMMVFGGVFDSAYHNDVWVLSNANGTGGTPIWSELSPSGTLPSPRGNNSTTYDPTTNSIILFGGELVGGQPLSDVWVLSNANGLGGTPAWTQLNPSSLYFAEARYFHTGVYNPSTNKMTIFGGEIDTTVSGVSTNDAWVISTANGR
jgi:hypothetical protein